VVSDELRGACDLLKVDLDQLIPRSRQKKAPTNFELWPEHALAWDVYLGCSTQWNVSTGLGVVFWNGLNYTGVEMVMRQYRVPDDQAPDVFEQIQVLERETLLIVNKPKR